MPLKGLYRESWRALVWLHDEGRVRSLGVSSFSPTLIEELISDIGVTPVVNQIQIHPHNQKTELREYQAARGIVTES